ncbi:PAS domain-containing protein [Methylobacterium sp. NEAU 140]|uniref:PAS domain-containing protein n=1 Tax=Methylobacterium sp. NEAU 140 TaxID=3064945 RepID=UPI002736BC00|nr:PAS domain-containing protein [Methylobacterium sp. NEAU 140]MDP4021697.1 PAS domain-containing protein [Methylobacterium sp. NEAU 140]
MQREGDDGCYEPYEDPRDHLRAALDASGVVGAWDWDCVRHTARYDRGAAGLLAGDPDLAGQDLRAAAAMACIHPEDMGWLRAKTERAIADGGLILAEYRILVRGRGIRWVLSRGRVYQDQHGRPVRCKGILIDITESRDGSRGYLAQAAPGTASGIDFLGEDPLSRAAARCLEARDALDAADRAAPDHLRLILDMALYEIGRQLARRALM